MREVLEHLEIPMRPKVCRVLRVQRTRSGRSWLIRVGVEVDGQVCPMRVLVPQAGQRPPVGGLVRFAGLRLVFDTIGGLDEVRDRGRGAFAGGLFPDRPVVGGEARDLR